MLHLLRLVLWDQQLRIGKPYRQRLYTACKVLFVKEELSNVLKNFLI